MKSPNEKLLREVQIDAFDKKGRGVGNTNTGGRLHVPFSIPGETVEAEKGKRKEGSIQTIINPSPCRTTPPCPHFGSCGGCAWQHINYEAQLDFKQNIIKNLFTQWGLPEPALPIQGSAPYHYRNRMDFVWWYNGNIGLRQVGKWHAMEALDECHLLPEDVMNTVLEIHNRVHQLQLPFRDQKRKTPGLRYLVVRRGVLTGDLMLNIVSDEMPLPESLWQDLPVTSVYQLVNNNPENDASDGEANHLYGAHFYREKILDSTLRVGPRSFFQPNPAVAGKMAEWIKTRINVVETKSALLDLYCGVGLFSAVFADQFERVMGIELSEDAIYFARQNCPHENTSFKCAPAESFIAEHWMEFDTLIVDPPRSGLHPKVLNAIRAAAFKNVFYVACNPRRSVEDIAKLNEHYVIADAALFDQFPQTPHVELIVHMQKRDAPVSV